jgi:hypothetical protein
MKDQKKISLREYAAKHNPRKNRRGHPMSESYLYRLIREDMKGDRIGKKEPIWFNYIFEGDKDHILIVLD